jgi:hypothetical protein
VNSDKFTAIFPVRDEYDSLLISIPFLVRNSKKLGEIYIVADTPLDSSFAAQSELSDLNIPLHFILNKKSGVFGAIETAVNLSDFELILICAADEIYPLLRMDEMAQALHSSFEFVSATRYSKGGKRFSGNKVARTLSRFSNYLLMLRYLGKLSDFTTGYKGFRKINWDTLLKNADGPGWSCALQFSLNALKNDLRLIEVPIISVDREMGGRSSFDLRPWVKGYLSKIR